MSSAGNPKELLYSKDHEWVRIEGDNATVGITAHAQEALGGVTYVDLPPVGKKIAQFGEIGAVESAKAASEIFSPLGGSIVEVNSTLENSPETINNDPYGEGWICRLSGINKEEAKKLLSPEDYQKLLEQEA